MNAMVSFAGDLLVEHYGRVGAISVLPGELDTNLHVLSPTGEEFLLRISAPGADRQHADYEVALLTHLGLHAPDLPVQRIVLSLRGEALVPIDTEGGQRLARLTTWLPGEVWARQPAVRGEARERAAEQLGRSLARLDRALASLQHPAAARVHRWDLDHAAGHLQAVALVDDAAKRDAAAAVLTRFRDQVLPRLKGQPRQILHNDANDYNVLVDPTGEICGLIDFGDSVETHRVHEVAIACCYAILAHPDPLRIATALVAAYHDEFALTETEAELLFDLIQTRCAVSICLAATQIRDDPSNEYLLISQHDMWNTLGQLMAENRDIAVMRMRAACGLQPVPTESAVERWLLRNGHRCVPVLRRDLSRLKVLDISVTAASATSLEPLFDDDALAQAVPVGRYGEDRALYQTPEFATADPAERRTIHVGIDLFAPAGDEILAPLDGIVADIGNETIPLGFGGILVLRHQTDDGTPFWTLYGHLSPDSLTPLAIGQSISAGDVVARLGTAAENGGWPPHLHFQLMTHLCGWTATEIIGVVTRSQWSVWRSVFLNPNLVLGLRADCSAIVEQPPTALRRERRFRLGRSLSLSYTAPLKIVAGEGVYLIDDRGERYLDMVNNVCHVGHCHPRVVAAGQRQMARLNTNSRYLHDNLLEYSRRLSAVLPGELSVVFMVNSGSEANDLALRLARAYTRQRGVVTVDHAYHGNLTSIVEVSPYKFAGPGGEGRADHVRVAEMPDLYRGRFRYGDPDAGARYADSVAAAVGELAQSGQGVGAFFSEGILGTGGMLSLPSGYLRTSYEAVRDGGGVCIADEVQLGFGRVGTQMWAFELHDVVPDIVTMGKPIGNGHPMAAVVTRADIAAAFANGMEYFSTFGGNPVSAAIGLEVLDVIRDERLLHNADEVGQFMMAGLRELAAQCHLIGDVRGSGLFIGVELVRDHDTREPAARELAMTVELMKAEHVLLSTEGPHHNVMKIKPPIVFSPANAEEFLHKLHRCLAITVQECSS